MKLLFKAALMAALLPTMALAAPNTGMYFSQAYFRNYSDKGVNSFINMQLTPSPDKDNTYILYGLIDEVINVSKITTDGDVEKLAELEGYFDEEKNQITLPSWQRVMRQKDENGEWHDVYFTGGHCGWDFEEEDRLQADNYSNLAVKGLPVNLSVNNSESASYSFLNCDVDFFFVWENPADNPKRFHYCEYFNCYTISQFNAIGFCEGLDEEECLPIAPHKSYFDSSVKITPYHCFVDIDGDDMSITNWSYGTYGGTTYPAVTFKRNEDSNSWTGVNLLSAVYGNPLNVYLWQVDENSELLGTERNLTVTTDSDEWGNTVVHVPAYRAMYYNPLNGKEDFRSNNRPARDLILYRTLPKLNIPDIDTNITPCEISDSETPVEYYNLQGMRIVNPTRGSIVIERRGNSSRKLHIL